MLRVHARAVFLALLLAPVPVGAQGPMVPPRWSVELAHDPEWVSTTERGVLFVARGDVALHAFGDGSVLGQAVIPGAGMITPARSGEHFGVLEPQWALEPSLLLGSSAGGTGGAPVNLAFALDRDAPAVRWTVPISPAPRVTVRGSTSLAHTWTGGSLELRALDAATGAIRWRTRFDRPHDDASVLLDDERAYLVSHDGWTAAVALPDGRVLFEQRARSQGAVHDALVVAGHVVLSGPRSVWALDGRTGRVLWRRAVDAPRIAAIGDGVVVLEHHRTVSIVAIDGSVRETLALARPYYVERVGQHVLAQGDELLVLDGRDARELARLPVAHHGAVASSGSWIAAVVSDGRERRRLVGLDVSTGRTWSAGRVAAASPIVIAGDVVAACTETGVVQGVDLSSGAARWRVSIGRQQGVAPCRLFAGNDTTLLAQGAGTRVHALDVHAPSARAPWVRVRARVVGPGRVHGIRVQVGTVWRTTDAHGELEARVRAWPTLTLRADPRSLPRCTSADDVHVDTTRSRRARVTLRFGVDHCLCHDCD